MLLSTMFLYFEMKRLDFSFLEALKTALLRNRSDSTSRASGSKKRKADDLTTETTQRRLRPSKELKTLTYTNTSVISGVKRTPKRRHIYVGGLSQHISVAEMEEYCETRP